MADDPSLGTQTDAGVIIVPAHNEAGRIGPLLAVLGDAVGVLHCRVIVVCNGCTDDTAALARRVPGLEVVELAESSKPAALNAGEALADTLFPRLYVDADVHTDVLSLGRLLAALRVEEPLAVRPTSQPVTSSCSWFVRRCVEGRELLPSSRQWSREHLEGHAVYGTNAAGRRRFDEFPPLTADDAFFDRMFDRDEKLVVRDALVRIPAPANARAYRAMLRRVFDGNDELDEWLRANRPDRGEVGDPHVNGPTPVTRDLSYFLHGGSTFPSWRPRVVLPVSMALAVRATARFQARRRRRRGHAIAWR